MVFRVRRSKTFGKNFLEQLASYTGGRLFEAGRSRSLLFQAFEGIAEELRRQYNIGYSPLNPGDKGERKGIKVRVYRPDLRVRARDSYVVGKRADKTKGIDSSPYYSRLAQVL